MVKKITILMISLILLCGIGYGIYNAYTNRVQATNNAPQVFAANRMLLELWSSYKKSSLEEGSSRTLDKTAQNITTSEGQSYTMMRSVWMDDMTTFDKSWQWTKDNHQRPDHLISWKFGALKDGKYGIQTDVGGENTASDADVDIAFSLLMASGRWKDPKYKADALNIIKSIWEKEVVTINDKPILAANDLERNNTQSIIVNPSYFSPYAYRVFAKVDPTHNWTGLIDSSYNILLGSSQLPLDKSSSVGLIPNLIRIDRTTNAILPASENNSNYGYDAIRTPWRMGLDWRWYKETRAKEVLKRLNFLSDKWQKNGTLTAEYTHDGHDVVPYSTPAIYGSSMAYFDVIKPELANDYYTRILLPYYDPDTQTWLKPLSYYDDNWVWFGMAYHNNVLPNLTELLHD